MEEYIFREYVRKEIVRRSEYRMTAFEDINSEFRPKALTLKHFCVTKYLLKSVRHRSALAPVATELHLHYDMTDGVRKCRGTFRTRNSFATTRIHFCFSLISF